MNSEGTGEVLTSEHESSSIHLHCVQHCGLRVVLGEGRGQKCDPIRGEWVGCKEHCNSFGISLYYHVK